MEANHCPVAIVGMSCFFPKSTGLKAYWRLLLKGQDAITEVPPTHWSTQDYYDPDPRRPDHVHCNRGGFLSPVSFDPSEFGIPPSTIEATDTSQLLALSAARQAIEDAGLPFDRSRTSVVLGVTGTQELVIPLGARLGHPHWRRALSDAGIAPALAEQIVARIADAYVPWQENSFPGLLGNVVAGRISNRFDLGGTNCVVDAACASSMAAVHLAMLELACGRSDTVITGGVDTLNDIFMHMCFAKTQALSATGDSRPFSKNADGTVLGEGLGLLVLKRLPDAERDGNRIYAVIRGIGTSSDGRSQSIYAPRVEGQAKALEAAYTRHRYPNRRQGRVPGPLPGTGQNSGEGKPLRLGLGQVHDRPHQGCRRECWPGEGSTRPPPQGAASDPQGRRARPRAERRGLAVLPQHPLPSLVCSERPPAASRSELFRIRRQQFSRSPGGIPPRKDPNGMGRLGPDPGVFRERPPGPGRRD
jgi:3-oxoacyl-(acyl-carrier-protein) synthase